MLTPSWKIQGSSRMSFSTDEEKLLDSSAAPRAEALSSFSKEVKKSTGSSLAQLQRQISKRPHKGRGSAAAWQEQGLGNSTGMARARDSFGLKGTLIPAAMSERFTVIHRHCSGTSQIHRLGWEGQLGTSSVRKALQSPTGRGPKVLLCSSSQRNSATDQAAARRALCPLHLTRIDPHYTNVATWPAC